MLDFLKNRFIANTYRKGRGIILLSLFIGLFLSCEKENLDPSDEPDDRNPMVIITEPDDGTTYQGDEPVFTKRNVFGSDLLLAGYSNFRIPVMVTTNQGTLLAFADMRTGGDLDPKTIVFRRSTDNGETWSQVALLEEQTTTKVYGNENLVVDKQTGTIHILYLQIFPSSTSTNSCNMYHRFSTDDGLTWSERELVPNVVNAKWRPLGPAAGIQLERGEHSGRLIFPGRYTDSSSGNYAIYSDDGGTTWNLGYKSVRNSSIGIENETTCIELANSSGNESTIYVNSRSEQNTSDLYRRLDAYSNDSGESLREPFQKNGYLKTDKCEGALLRWSAIDKGAEQNRILFSSLSWAKEDVSVSAQSRRRHVGIWSSFDETETWTPVAKRVNDLRAGYSSMAKTADGFIGILFEEGESSYYNEISFVKVNEAFLDVPLIGAKWDFEEKASGKSLAENTKLLDTYSGGTSRDIKTVGTVSTIEGSEVFKQNTALQFDGSSYLMLSDVDTWTQFDFNENSSFSFEMVLKADKLDFDSFLAGRPHQSSWPQWEIVLEQEGTVSFRIDDDESFAYVKTKSNVADGKWHHIGVVRDRSIKKIKIYVDGELSNVVADNVQGSLANRRPFYVGGQPDEANMFKGEIDFIRISPYAISDFIQ